MPLLAVQDAQVHVEDTGGGGDTVVFLHGFLFDGRMFDAQVSALRRRYRCITIDWRGQGRSPPAQRGFELDQHTDDVRQVLRQLGVSRAHFAGVSMGGYVCLRFASREPELVASQALINTGAGPHPLWKYPEQVVLSWLARMVGITRWPVAPAVAKALFGKAFLTSPSAASTRELWRERWGHLDVPSTVRTLAGVMRRQAVLDVLPDIQVPTLVIQGAEDRHHPPRDGKLLAQRIPHATYLELEGVGHSAPLEAPDVVSSALERFLAGSTT